VIIICNSFCYAAQNKPKQDSRVKNENQSLSQRFFLLAKSYIIDYQNSCQYLYVGNPFTEIFNSCKTVILQRIRHNACVYWMPIRLFTGNFLPFHIFRKEFRLKVLLFRSGGPKQHASGGISRTLQLCIFTLSASQDGGHRHKPILQGS
jgi:hypothetical protein